MNESYSKQIYDGSDGTNNDIYSCEHTSVLHCLWNYLSWDVYGSPSVCSVLPPC